jgi:hypothetical protein
MLKVQHLELHVPRFRARVDTGRPGYMIPIRLSWLHRARPSATLHEIQGLLNKSKLGNRDYCRPIGLSSWWLVIRRWSLAVRRAARH